MLMWPFENHVCNRRENSTLRTQRCHLMCLQANTDTHPWKKITCTELFGAKNMFDLLEGRKNSDNSTAVNSKQSNGIF